MNRVRISDLTFGYRGAPAILKGLSAMVELPEGGGHIAALVGRSGCGKTTLLKLIAGTERPLSGLLTLEPPGATISYLPQDSSILEHLSVRDAVYLYGEIAATRHLFSSPLVEEVIDELELRGLINGSVAHSRLSGGEKRRLALARALSISPRLLLLDEPCSGLDRERKISFLKLLRQTVDRHQVIAIYVTHHADEVDLASDSIIYMKPADGSVSELINMPTENFRDRPPGLEAAQFILGYDHSALPCIVSGENILTASGNLLGSTIGSSGIGGSATVMFASSGVVPRIGGLRVAVVGRSSQYAILRDGSGTSFFAAPSFDSTIGEVGLSGPVMLFSAPEAPALRVTCI